MLRIAMTAAFALTMAGCTAQADTPWSKIEAAAAVQELNTSSPDMTVKSWWDTQDAEIRLSKTVCEQTAAMRPSARNSDQLLTGDIRASIVWRNGCGPDHFSRSIDDVDIQSPTLAFVLATIKNDTPPDDGWTGSAQDKRTKSQGEKYRYRLERSSEMETWKISQIEEHSRYSGAWESVVEGFGPRGHVYVSKWYQ